MINVSKFSKRGLEVNLTDKRQRGKDDRVALSQNKLFLLR